MSHQSHNEDYCSDCESVSKSSHKHYIYRDYKTLASAGDCGQACRLTTWCQSISYRPTYSSGQADIGNCLLSDIKAEELRDVGDFVKDASWDIYTVSFDPSCLNGNNPGSTSQVRPAGECRLMTLVKLRRLRRSIIPHCSHPATRRTVITVVQTPSSATDVTASPTDCRTSSRRTGGTPALSRPVPSSVPTELPVTLSATGKSLSV